MAKRFDYYAGYPSQQRTPKWVGVTLGSLFGGLTIIALAIGIRMVLPARSAEASAVQKQEVSAPLLAAAPAEAPKVVAAAAVEQDDEAAPAPQKRSHVSRGKHRHGKAGRVALMSSKKAAKVAKAAPNPKYKKAQVFAKSVAGGRRDKKARDELDKMLGL